MTSKALIALVTFVVLGTIGVMGAAAHIQRQTRLAGCLQLGENHTVTIHESKLSTVHMTAKRCDTLTIRNQDEVVREIGFGPHDHHIPYDGISERVLRPGQSFTLTLNKTGDYGYHDHYHDEVAGTFSVR